MWRKRQQSKSATRATTKKKKGQTEEMSCDEQMLDFDGMFASFMADSAAPSCRRTSATVRDKLLQILVQILHLWFF